VAITLFIGDKNYSSWSMRPWLVLHAFGIQFTEKLIPSTDFLKARSSNKPLPNIRQRVRFPFCNAQTAPARKLTL